MGDRLDIFLLIGQSNMAGRGRLIEVSALRDPRVFMFRDGRWMIAEEPLHTDKPEIAGVGLGMSFATELLHNRQTPIGLLPCAVGGTPLSRWMPGADLYEKAVSVTRQAVSQDTLRGILWHQGEGDSCKAEDANNYGQRFQSMIGQLRTDLSAADIPVVAGELGQFLREFPGCNYSDIVNRQLRELEGKKARNNECAAYRARRAAGLPAYGCATSEGLTDNGDKAHFNSQSLREFGCRYARKYMDLRERGSAPLNVAQPPSAVQSQAGAPVPQGKVALR